MIAPVPVHCFSLTFFYRIMDIPEHIAASVLNIFVDADNKFSDLCLYWAQISGERLQDHWSSGLKFIIMKLQDTINSIISCLYILQFFILSVIHLSKQHDSEK